MVEFIPRRKPKTEALLRSGVIINYPSWVNEGFMIGLLLILAAR